MAAANYSGCVVVPAVADYILALQSYIKTCGLRDPSPALQTRCHTDESLNLFASDLEIHT